MKGVRKPNNHNRKIRLTIKTISGEKSSMMLIAKYKQTNKQKHNTRYVTLGYGS